MGVQGGTNVLLCQEHSVKRRRRIWDQAAEVDRGVTIREAEFDMKESGFSQSYWQS